MSDREGGTSNRHGGALARAQIVAILVGGIGLVLSLVLKSDVVDGVWVVGIFAAAVLGLMRWRRGESPYPDGF